MENGVMSRSSLPVIRIHVLHKRVKTSQLHTSKPTFFDLLDAQHVVQCVAHEGGGVLHQAQGLQVSLIQVLALLQDLDADGERVQRAAKLVEDVLEEVSAGLVDVAEVFLREGPASAL